ncbi:MAG: glycerophosphodiester phosphodiesterase [bacterium]|nr:glycerophosphodiester phosphodiesterase [bacterium]
MTGWIVLICLVVFGAALVFFIAPGRQSDAQRAPFLRRTFAHRGLYTADQRIPENSLPAFRAAVEAGYGVELDVQLTRDKQIVVFHDDTLLRACGVDARVDAFTYAELTERMRLFGTEETIPLFSQVLAALGGRVPAIVELKSGGDRFGLCERTLAMLRSYAGAFCIESFDPYIVRWFYKHAPDILRGQLSEQMRYSRSVLGLWRSFLMSRLFSNFAARAQFVAYRVGPKPWTVRLCERMGAMRVVWTARPTDCEAALERAYDAIIFEHYRPDSRY